MDDALAAELEAIMAECDLDTVLGRYEALIRGQQAIARFHRVR